MTLVSRIVFLFFRIQTVSSVKARTSFLLFTAMPSDCIARLGDPQALSKYWLNERKKQMNPGTLGKLVPIVHCTLRAPLKDGSAFSPTGPGGNRLRERESSSHAAVDPGTQQPGGMMGSPLGVKGHGQRQRHVWSWGRRACWCLVAALLVSKVETQSYTHIRNSGRVPSLRSG